MLYICTSETQMSSPQIATFSFMAWEPHDLDKSGKMIFVLAQRVCGGGVRGHWNNESFCRYLSRSRKRTVLGQIVFILLKNNEDSCYTKHFYLFHSLGWNWSLWRECVSNLAFRACPLLENAQSMPVFYETGSSLCSLQRWNQNVSDHHLRVLSFPWWTFWFLCEWRSWRNLSWKKTCVISKHQPCAENFWSSTHKEHREKNNTHAQKYMNAFLVHQGNLSAITWARTEG